MNVRKPNYDEIQNYIESFIKKVKALQLMEGKNKENENTVKLYKYYNHNEEIAIVLELYDENLNTMIINKNQNFTFSEIKEILNQLIVKKKKWNL